MTNRIDAPLPGGSDIGCGTCAFRQGCETRREPYNTVRALICALGGVPFYCHHDRQGHDFHGAESARPPLVELRVCQGWKAQVREHARNPKWRESLGFRRAFATLGLGAIEQLTADVEPDEHRRLLRTIKQVVQALGRVPLKPRIRRAP